MSRGAARATLWGVGWLACVAYASWAAGSLFLPPSAALLGGTMTLLLTALAQPERERLLSLLQETALATRVAHTVIGRGDR